MWWLCAATSIAVGDLVINEVLYDPPGPDSGHEFIELFNSGIVPVDLDGVRVLFLNGADPDDPDELWSGEPTTRLPPGGFFVLGESLVGARDRTVKLGLQNGDEAVEVWRGGIRLDALAWGEAAGLAEGDPVDGGRGVSLGRVPDGHDTDSNRRDFRELPVPTPGGANLAESGFALDRWWTDPVWREDAGDAVLYVEVLPTGWGEVQTGTLTLGSNAFPLRAAPADTLRFSTRMNWTPGAVGVDLRLASSDGIFHPVGPAELWCGLHDLAIVEVQARPAAGEPEWFELFNPGSSPVPLSGWGVRDRGNPVRRLSNEGELAPGERIVFCADVSALRRHYPRSDARALVPVGGWPTLNDTSADVGVAADSLHLVSPTGLVADLVVWRADEIEDRGRTLQRGALSVGVRSVWMPSIGTATPGVAAGEEARHWPASGIQCGPDPFTPDADGVDDQLEILLVGDWSRVSAAIFDLQGDAVRELQLSQAGSRHAARWDGTDARGRPVPAGAWVVVVEAENRSGAPVRLRRVVGLGRRR